MKDLLGGRYYPLTSNITFINEGIEELYNDFIEENKNPMDNNCRDLIGLMYVARRLEGDLDTVLQNCIAGAEGDSFVAIETEGDWRACIPINYGCSVHLPRPMINRKYKRISITNLRSFRSGDGLFRGGYGAVHFDYKEMLGYETIKSRWIGVCEEGARWEINGEIEKGAFEFEDLNIFRKGPVRDRFTELHLEKYLEHFGIRLFDNNFYHGRAVFCTFSTQKMRDNPSYLYSLARHQWRAMGDAFDESRWPGFVPPPIKERRKKNERGSV